MVQGFQVDPDALRLTAKGINTIIEELNNVGATGMGLSGAGEAGTGFFLISLTNMQAGHPDVAAALSEFCHRWSWEINQLIDGANKIATDLNLDAGDYRDAEHYLAGVAKTLTRDAIGDPYATDRAEDQTWAQVTHYGPDLTPADAIDHTGQVWSRVEHEAVQAWSKPWERYLPDPPHDDGSNTGAAHSPPGAGR